MSTVIRPEVSKKNPYWLERHRYYELKHFCLQYPIWKQAYASLSGLEAKRLDGIFAGKTNAVSDPTERCAEARIFYADRMQMIEQAAKDADASMAFYLVQAVTQGLSYESVKAKLEIPCGRDAYYGLYRKFFYLLHKERQ